MVVIALPLLTCSSVHTCVPIRNLGSSFISRVGAAGAQSIRQGEAHDVGSDGEGDELFAADGEAPVDLRTRRTSKPDLLKKFRKEARLTVEWSMKTWSIHS